MTHVAEIDQRLTAYVVDRVIGWSIAAGVGYAVWRLGFAPGQVWAGILVGLGVLVLLGAVLAVLLGTTGLSPGKALTGLRVVRRDNGQPIGVVAALLRTAVVGAAGLPTLGLGVATLGWTAAMNADRRGLHDRIGDAVVVDARRPVTTEEPERVKAAPIVNLTAMRLMPGPDALSAATPAPPPAASGGAPVPPPPPPPPPPAPDQISEATVQRTADTGEHPQVGVWWVEFDTGEAFAVEGLVLVGRRPEPRHGEAVWRAVSLRSDDMSISKTHAQFQVTPDGALVVMDRGSTNGTFVVRQGLSKALSPGRPSTLLTGDQVRFGDRQMVVSAR